jgi:hypothetical protein
MRRPAIDYQVLDALADDIESVPHIRERVAGSSQEPGPQLTLSLRRLVEDRLIEACVYHDTAPTLVPAGEGVWPRSAFDDLWFRITPHGLMVHGSWEPDASAGTA